MSPNPHIRRAQRRAFLLRHAGPLSLLCAIALTLAACLIATRANAQEIPSWVIRGIAAVETGVQWRDLGDIRGTWTRGSIGECGPWQLSPAVLRDLGAYDKRSRIHADPILAESLTRAWLLRLRARTGCWPTAVAAFHAGAGRRHMRFAIEYADRVRAVGVIDPN